VTPAAWIPPTAKTPPLGDDAKAALVPEIADAAPRTRSAEIAALVPGASVVEALQLPHSADLPQDRAIPQSVRVGTVVAAPIAPAKGQITARPGSWVALAAKKAKDSPTMRIAALIVLAGLGRAALVFADAFNGALASGKHIFQIPWLDTAYTALDKTWGFFTTGAGAALLKLWDNNPVVSGLKSPPPQEPSQDSVQGP
jgi:hypothetical protein